MFSRFSPAAKRVLRAAEQACRNHNHYYVGVGHLLLALIEEHDPAVDAFFTEREIARSDLLADVRRSLGTGDDRLWDGILVTPRVRGVVSRAERGVAAGEPVEPLHLLAAMLAEDAGLASDLVARHVRNSAAPGRVGR